MVEVAYVMNTIVCLICALLLMVAWRRSRSRLIMLSALCFLTLSINNVLIFVDVLVVPDLDLSLLRAASALLGFSILLFGLIWET